MAERARIKRHARRELNKSSLGELIGANARVLRVLDKHGVTFCAGCYLTLFATPEKAALYHAVPNVGRFLAELKRAIRSSSPKI